MKIGLLGQFGSGNSGNDGSLEAMIHFLRRARPDAELVCICGNPEAVRQQFGIEAIGISTMIPDGIWSRISDAIPLDALRRILNILWAMRQSRGMDLIIFPGTGILDDFRDDPSGWPFVVFRWCLGARLVGTKLAFVSVGAGPVRHRVSRWLIKSAARLASYRSYRDRVSYAFMESIGLDVSRDRVFPDLAFGLPTPPRPLRVSAPLTVGVGVMAYFGWMKGSDGGGIYRNYLSKLTAFVEWLLDQGYQVRLLTGDVGDMQAIADLRRALSRDVIAEDGLTLQTLMHQIAQTDLMVATRYHNVVCAVKLGKPTISLGYAAKNDVILSDAGLGNFCQHIETLDLELLKHQFNYLRNDLHNFEQSVRESAAQYQVRLNQQETILQTTLLTTSGSPIPASA